MADVDDVATKVAKLKTLCDAAYDADIAAKSCSHAVWLVLQGMVADDFDYRTANTLIDFLGKESSKWRPVDIDTAFELANKGVVVVGGAKATGNGHVIIVYPGTKLHSGGYAATNKKGRFTMPIGKLYPRALSRSIGSWPGGVSRGDKTVWDPWGTDLAFKAVKFWSPL